MEQTTGAPAGAGVAAPGPPGPAPAVPGAAPPAAGGFATTVAVLAVAASLAFRFAYAAFRPLLPDEAYYWLWTRHLSAGYFDHPPGVAYLIWASTRLFGETELGVRALGILLVAGAVALCLRMARDVGVDRRGLLLLLAVWLTSPLLAGLATMMTPDTPAAFFATATLAAAVRIAVRLQRGESPRWEWPAMGALGGMALTSKYTAALTGVAVAGAFLTHPRGRRMLLTPGPYLTLAAAALVFLPVVVWNARHGWASFQFQASHGLGGLGERERNPVAAFLLFFGAQAGMWTPVLFALGAVATAANWRNYRRLPLPGRVLTWAATVPLLVFAYASTRAHGEENWPNLAYFPMSVLLAEFVARAWPRRLPVARIGCAVALAVFAVVHFPEVLRAAHLRTPVSLRNLFGWPELGAEIGRAAAAASPDLVLADRMQDAAELSFYMPGRPQVWFYRPPGRRPSAFDFFDHVPDPRAARRVLFVGNHSDEFCNAYGFEPVSSGLWTYRHGRNTPDRTRSYWVLTKKGADPTVGARMNTVP